MSPARGKDAATASAPVIDADCPTDRLPFSFRYDHVDSAALLRVWPRRRDRAQDERGVVTDTTTWTEPGDGLQVTWTLRSYPGSPARTWQVELRNLGDGTSRQLTDVLAVDVSVGTTALAPSVIRTLRGSNYTPHDFAVLNLPLLPESYRLLSCVGGRPTNSGHDLRTDGTFVRNGWPYLDLDLDDHGALVALGWPGQWGIQVTRSGTLVRITGGVVSRDHAEDGDTLEDLVLTDTYLEAGESFLTPLVALLPWQAEDDVAPHNAWRRFLVDHVVPRFRGGPVPSTLSGAHFNLVTTAAEQARWVDAVGEAGLTRAHGGDISTWWIDAGWYASCGDQERDWVRTGDWDVHPGFYPDGMAPLTDRAREHGMSTILWFEPERVWLGSELAASHPDWLLRWEGPSHLQRADSAILDFGNDEARTWMTATVNRLLAGTGTNRIAPDVPGYYREDFNIDPLPHWNAADVPGRTGMTQIRHCLGHLRFWADVQAANPDLLIDTCASGGRRLDLLTISMSVPLLRSDLIGPPEVAQRQHFGLARWLPLSGNQSPAGVDVRDGYAHRSAFAPMWGLPLHVDDPRADLREAASLTAEWRAITPTYLGDFHPISADDSGDLLVWQQTSPDGSVVAVQAFNRGEAGEPVVTRVPITGLEPGGDVTVVRYSGTRTAWRASAGFSGEQGRHGWRYEFADGDGERQPGRHMWGTWTWPTWTSPAGVTATSLRLAAGTTTARTWTAPADGVVTIDGSAYLRSGPVGRVELSIDRDGELLAEATLTDQTQAVRVGAGLTIEVTAGTRVSFAARLLQGEDWTEVVWDPTVTLTTPAEPDVSQVAAAELAADGLGLVLPARSATTVVLIRDADD